ncbi:MAG: Mn2+-dependent serine/threonine protein kinase [Candidatus Parvarchaeum acidiphilum ARMAN-4]|jgi:tRNA A-37 threonylcarbamoyl transferase component Bud32|uniref:Mn2+-dependent serine/threonine protein kinase n=1 Tax=Candidatus Parvarchaeum acidiphilum ARMAN-4 TaxID=662760 RepID=D2EGJ5_PARA4|nr:MAG: Mn2+-dependent serine/threonine protein kinase [Candidatus Parvarchaeum acidiphilum ARMAN-4]
MVLSQILMREEADHKVIRKKYNSFNSYKWLISPLFRVFYPFAISSKSRLERELNFLNSGNEIKKPKVYSFDTSLKEMDREYIEGDVEYCDGSKTGKLLSSIHKEGYSLGDSKLDNFICNQEGAYIIDSEQAIKSDKKRYNYWDVSFLILSAAYYNYSNKIGFKRFLEGFSKEYIYWQDYQKRAIKGIYSLVFLFMPLQHLYSLKEAISKR